MRTDSHRAPLCTGSPQVLISVLCQQQSVLTSQPLGTQVRALPSASCLLCKALQATRSETGLVREEALTGCQELRRQQKAFCPSWQLDLTLELSSSFYFPFFGELASNYLVLFILHPSFMVQKTCRCKYVPPSLTSPPFLIYVISIFLPCTVN